MQEFGTDKLRRAWTSIEGNLYDMEAWSLIIRDAQNRNIEESRTIFEKLVDTFTTTGKFWKMYIEQEVRFIYGSVLYWQLMKNAFGFKLSKIAVEVFQWGS